MDDRIHRFKHCDPRFYPYLDRVFSRLSEGLRDKILSNAAFQVLADTELPKICGRCFDFDPPVEKLIYLNTRALMQPNDRLICSIAWEVAGYVAGKEGRGGDERRIEELLVGWGFERAYSAVCFCDAIAGSTVFRSGYEWAKRQSEDYLMLHFGLYFDDWNEKGLARISDDRIEALLGQISISRLLPGTAIGEEKGVPEGISVDEVLIEGIMAGLKKIKLQGH